MRLIERGDDVDRAIWSGAVHSLRFYRCRSDSANTLVRLPWSAAGLQALAQAPTAKIIHADLRPPWADRKAAGLRELAALMSTQTQVNDAALRSTLRAIPGIGPERADYAGVFGFRMPWPIVDEYLWRLLDRHGILTLKGRSLKGYKARRTAFEPHWKLLADSHDVSPDELAATLHLWACEASRFEFMYW